MSTTWSVRMSFDAERRKCLSGGCFLEQNIWSKVSRTLQTSYSGYNQYFETSGTWEPIGAQGPTDKRYSATWQLVSRAWTQYDAPKDEWNSQALQTVIAYGVDNLSNDYFVRYIIDKSLVVDAEDQGYSIQVLSRSRLGLDNVSMTALIMALNESGWSVQDRSYMRLLGLMHNVSDGSPITIRSTESRATRSGVGSHDAGPDDNGRNVESRDDGHNVKTNEDWNNLDHTEDNDTDVEPREFYELHAPSALTTRSSRHERRQSEFLGHPTLFEAWLVPLIILQVILVAGLLAFCLKSLRLWKIKRAISRERQMSEKAVNNPKKASKAVQATPDTATLVAGNTV